MIFKKSYAKEINLCTTTAQNMFTWRQQICSMFRHITGATDDGTCHEPKHVADLPTSNEHILRM